MRRRGDPVDFDGFVEQAEMADYPFDTDGAKTDIKEAVLKLVVEGPEQTLESVEFVNWKKRAEELDEDEKKEFAEAGPMVKPRWGNHPDPRPDSEGAWRGKRTKLFAEMARAAGVQNADMIADYIRNGAPIVGEIPPCGLFEEKITKPTKTIRQVLQGAKWSKPILRATIRPHRDERVDREVSERTMEEVDEGKAQGPYTENELGRRFAGVWAPVRRVGLLQSMGVRSIDDFTGFGHNSTSNTAEYIDLGGTPSWRSPRPGCRR